MLRLKGFQENCAINIVTAQGLLEKINLDRCDKSREPYS